jgi:hypothetical protein
MNFLLVAVEVEGQRELVVALVAVVGLVTAVQRLESVQ